jgi:hypothetical protein
MVTISPAAGGGRTGVGDTAGDGAFNSNNTFDYNAYTLGLNASYFI